MSQAEAPSRQEETVLHEVLEAMRGLRHGSVQIFVQDGRVVQIDTLEKKRLDLAALTPALSPRTGEGR
jgi:hypothetical protein